MDYGDWFIRKDLVKMLTNKWCKVSIDRFASNGLSSAPFVFAKLVRPLMKHWRLHAVKIACFLDDGSGIACTYQDALSYSNFVKVI